PEEAAPQYGAHLGYLEFLGHMAKRRVEDLTLAVPAFPHDRHDHALDPVGISTRESRRREDFVRGIDMHVILLRAVVEIADALHDGIVAPRDVDAIIDDVPRMRDPLAAAHELIGDALAEGIAHAAVEAAEPHAALDGPGQVVDLLLLDLRHRVDRDDEAHIGD